jgi:hypothetical protein
MNGTVSRSFRDQIAARITTYYDMGYRDVWSIYKQLSADLGNEDWQGLFLPTDSYYTGHLLEEDIIQDVLTHAGKTDFVYHGNDVDVFIGQRWESGCRDLLHIVQQTVQWLRDHNDLITAMDEAVVRGVLTQMGYIV